MAMKPDSIRMHLRRSPDMGTFTAGQVGTSKKVGEELADLGYWERVDAFEYGKYRSVFYHYRLTDAGREARDAPR